jgi:hypothetical protein
MSDTTERTLSMQIDILSLSNHIGAFLKEWKRQGAFYTYWTERDVDKRAALQEEAYDDIGDLLFYIANDVFNFGMSRVPQNSVATQRDIIIAVFSFFSRIEQGFCGVDIRALAFINYSIQTMQKDIAKFLSRWRAIVISRTTEV